MTSTLLLMGFALQIVAPPWLAMGGLLIFLRSKHWLQRSVLASSVTLLWSVAVGMSPILGVVLGIIMFWADDLLNGVIPDLRWRLLLVSAVGSLLWGVGCGTNWTLGVLCWWLAQGLLLRLLMRIFKHDRSMTSVFREPKVG